MFQELTGCMYNIQNASAGILHWQSVPAGENQAEPWLWQSEASLVVLMLLLDIIFGTQAQIQQHHHF